MMIKIAPIPRTATIAIMGRIPIIIVLSAKEPDFSRDCVRAATIPNLTNVSSTGRRNPCPDMV
jgi:hypothetical protein